MRKGIVLALACSFAGLLASPSFGQSGIEVEKDVRYVSRPGGALALDAYLPNGPGPHPAVLVIPGGRWMLIDKAKNDWLPRQIAERGIAAFAINYRPSTRAPFPAALEDAQAAVRFVRAHADRFNIDPARIGAVGGSSGGHLAALLAVWGEGPTDVGARVRVAVSWSEPMDLPGLLTGRQDVVSAVETFLGCSAPADCADAAREASPITHVDPSDGAVYLANSTDEIIPESQAEEMAAALERSGVAHELTLLAPGPHGFSAAMSDKGFDPAFAFLAGWIDSDASAGATPSPASGDPTPSKTGAGAPIGGTEGQTTERRGDLGTERDRLPVLAVGALAMAVAVLIVAILLLRRVSRVTAGIVPPAEEPDREAPASLVGSRRDDTES